MDFEGPLTSRTAFPVRIKMTFSLFSSKFLCIWPLTSEMSSSPPELIHSTTRRPQPAESAKSLIKDSKAAPFRTGRSVWTSAQRKHTQSGRAALQASPRTRTRTRLHSVTRPATSRRSPACAPQRPPSSRTTSPISQHALDRVFRRAWKSRVHQ